MKSSSKYPTLATGCTSKLKLVIVKTSAFMSNFPNPRAVSGPSHRLSNKEDSRRFKPASFVDVPQITHEE